MMIRLFIALTILCGSYTSWAQTTNLPKGIGMYFFGYRQFAPQTQKYNDEGQLEPLAKPLQKDFSGPKLLEGVGGAQLKQLAEHIQRFDSYSEADNSLLNSLNLGELDGQVDGKFSGQSVGLGFGITDKFSALLIVPFISASVDTEIQFRGANNAQQIKQRLGALAYQELQDGLDQAAQITTNQIKQTIEQEGYAPLDHWSYNGIGDIKLAGIYGFNLKTGYSYLKSNSAIETSVSIPTGYVDDPDILTDVSVGKGYYSLGGQFKQYFTFYDRFNVNGSAGVDLNMPTKMEKRVPEEEEAIIALDRKTMVDLTPGQDFLFTGGAGVDLGLISLSSTLGRKVHTRDTYSGSIDGNYDALAKTSEKSQTYIEFGANFSTVDLYKSGKFALPFLLGAKYHHPIVAKNYIDERYFEVTVASFFATPMAAKDSDYRRKNHKKQRAELGYRKATGLKKKHKRKSQREDRSMYGHHH